MRFHALALHLAAALPLVWSVPEYFLLKAVAAPGQTGKSNLVGGYMNQEYGDPTFYPINEGGATYSIQPFHTASKLGYLYQNATSFAFKSRLEFQPNVFEGGAWQPVQSVGAKSKQMPTTQGHFYINGTGSDMNLVWRNRKDGGALDFAGWIVCDFTYGVPQLFFMDYYVNPKNLPASCAEIVLQVIPIPNGKS